MCEEGRLLQREAEQHGREPEAERIGPAAREHTERARQADEDDQLLRLGFGLGVRVRVRVRVS